MAEIADIHIPVLASRIVELLSPALGAPGAVYVDGTLGMAGHSALILQACPQAQLVGIDRDDDALQIAAERLRDYSGRVHLVQAVHDELDEILDDLGFDQIDAMLLDLGLSSLQIDNRERGFSYSVDAPLDMRMDAQAELTAAAIVNHYEPSDLVRILREYGEERFADRIVRAIVAARQTTPIQSSAQLVDIISSAIPAAARSKGGHPGKRTFQALRIEVNGELDTLGAVLPVGLGRLRVGGRFAVLSYHSLEDRMVKHSFRAATSDQAPRHLPVVPESLKAQFRTLTRGAESPSPAEVADNPRAASARLRAVERIKEAP